MTNDNIFFAEPGALTAVWQELLRLANDCGIELPSWNWQQIITNPKHAAYWHVNMLLICAQWIIKLRDDGEGMFRLEKIKQLQRKHPVLTMAFPSMALVSCFYNDIDFSTTDSASINDKSLPYPGCYHLPAGCTLRLQKDTETKLDVTTCSSAQVLPIAVLSVKYSSLEEIKLTNNQNPIFLKYKSLLRNHYAVENSSFNKSFLDDSAGENISAGGGEFDLHLSCFSKDLLTRLSVENSCRIEPRERTNYSLQPLKIHLPPKRKHSHALYFLLTQHVRALYLSMSWLNDLLDEAALEFVDSKCIVQTVDLINKYSSKRFYLGGASCLMGDKGLQMPHALVGDASDIASLHYYNYGMYAVDEPYLFLQANIWRSTAWVDYNNCLQQISELCQLWKNVHAQRLGDAYKKLAPSAAENSLLEATITAVPLTVCFSICSKPVYSFCDQELNLLTQEDDFIRHDNVSSQIVSAGELNSGELNGEELSHAELNASSDLLKKVRLRHSQDSHSNFYKENMMSEVDESGVSKKSMFVNTVADDYLLYPHHFTQGRDYQNKTALPQSESDRFVEATSLGLSVLKKITAEDVLLNIIPVVDVHQIAMQPIILAGNQSPLELSVSATDAPVDQGKDLITILKVCSVAEIATSSLHAHQPKDNTSPLSAGDNRNCSTQAKKVYYSAFYLPVVNDSLDLNSKKDFFTSAASAYKFAWHLDFSPSDSYFNVEQKLSVNGFGYHLRGLASLWSSACCGYLLSLADNATSLTMPSAYLDITRSVSREKLIVDFNAGFNEDVNAGGNADVNAHNNINTNIKAAADFFSANNYLENLRQTLRFKMIADPAPVLAPIFSRLGDISDAAADSFIRQSTLLRVQDCAILWKNIQQNMRRFATASWVAAGNCLSLLATRANWVELQGKIQYVWDLTWQYNYPADQVNKNALTDAASKQCRLAMHKSYIVFYNLMQFLPKVTALPVILVARVLLNKDDSIDFSRVNNYPSTLKSCKQNFSPQKSPNVLWTYSSHLS